MTQDAVHARSTDRKTTKNPLRGGDYRYAIDYKRANGRALGLVAIDPDFQAALECTYFAGVRRDVLPAVSAAATGRVSPLWCNDRGEPYCRGIRIDIPTPFGHEPVQSEISNEYFKAYAENGAQDWLAKGQLEPGERYTYRVCAYPIAGSLQEAERDAGGEQDDTDAPCEFRVEEIPSPIPVLASPIDAFRERATETGPADPCDAPAFIPRSVIDEARALAGEAGARETGGVLIGHLRHDTSLPESFIEITAQVPAKHAEASGTSFAFTHETWSAADAAIALRGRGELLLGWWHSHPRFCNPECPEERQRLCPLASPFFSVDDVHLHHVCFPRAYQIALLISDLPGKGPTPAVFGWRDGAVAERGYSART